MKPIKIAGACIAVAITLSGVVTSLSYASPQSANSPLAEEISVLTDYGISPARAKQAIEVRSLIANTNLADTVENAMAGQFAGLWFEASTARMHVGVVSASGRRLAERVVRRAGLSRYVIETPVRSTWAQLVAAQNHWNGKLGNLLMRGELTTALLPQSNAVEIELSASVPARERAAIEHEAANDSVDAVVSVVPSSQLESTGQQATSCNTFASDKANCNKTITSGVAIESTVKEVCTAGPLAVKQGTNKSETFLLTAGHCQEKIGESWFAFDRSGKKTEIGKSVDLVLSQNGDYSDISVENNAWKNAGAKPVLAVTAEWDTTENRSFPVRGQLKPMAGTPNCHEGKTSGHSCGLVNAVNQTIRFKYANDLLVTVKGIVADHGPSLKTAGGDSGGPWYFLETNKEVLIEGSHVGANATRGFYEPIETSLGSLKLELLTTANETRPQLGVFNSSTSGALLAKALSTQVFTSAAGKIECTALSAKESEIAAGTTKTVRITVEYEKCTAFGLAATVSLAKYEFNSTGFVNLRNTITATATGCTVTITSVKNQELKTVSYSNSGNELTIEPNVTGLASSGAGFACNYEEESKGTYTGNSLGAVNGGSLQWE